MKHHPSRAGLTRDSKAGPVWTGEVRANEPALQQVLAWKKPRRIFWNAHGDLFHENVPDEWIDRQFAVMALTPQHTHMVLTKRPERMRDYVSAIVETFHASPDSMDERFGDLAVELTASPCAAGAFEEADWPLRNVWLGTSVEDDTRAHDRIAPLMDTPAAKRFLSCEPLLGPVSLKAVLYPSNRGFVDALTGKTEFEEVAARPHARPVGGYTGKLDWVIAGGESGPGSRPMCPDWVRSLRDQCADAGVAFFFKQWGEYAPVRGEAVEPSLRNVTMRYGKRAAGNLLDGRQHLEWPA